jgi:RNA polymerase sigma factor (sigma-70 family)
LSTTSSTPPGATGTAHDAEDLTSAVFVKALHSIDRYQDRGLPFVAFLYRIARNAAIDRSRTLKQPLSVDELVTEPSSKQNVEADATLAVDRSILLAALTKLKTEHRDVIVMRFIEDSNPRDAHVTAAFCDQNGRAESIMSWDERDLMFVLDAVSDLLCRVRDRRAGL